MFTLKARLLSILVFMTKPASVDERFDKGVCGWSCSVSTGKALSDVFQTEKPLNLAITYKGRVDLARCANETKSDTITISTAIVWLKSFADNQTSAMAIITRSILEVIFSGQFFTGSPIEMTLSCNFELTSKKNSTNDNHQPSTPLHSPLSILYYIENLANYSKTNSTLVLMKVDKRFRIYLVTAGAAGNQSSHTFTKDSELFTFEDSWLPILVIIWFSYGLYYPLIFRLFRPSKLEVKLPKKDRQTASQDEDIFSLEYPVQEEDWAHETKPRQSASQLCPTEHVEETDTSHQPNAKSENLTDSVRKAVAPCSGGKNSASSSVASCIILIDQGTDEENCGHDGSGQATIERSRQPDQSSVDGTPETDNTSATQDDYGLHNGATPDESDQVTSEVERREQYPPRKQPDQSSPMDKISETDHTHVIIVGETNPVGVGSFIGNSLFSLSNKSKKVVALKVIFSFILPFYFTALGHFLLLMLPRFSKQISASMPSPFFFDSVFYSTIKHPALLILVVLSALCYVIQLVSVCYLCSKNSEKTGVSCSLHSKSFICVVYEKLQLLLPALLNYKSLCNPSTPCRSWHCYCFIYVGSCQLWKGLSIVFWPVYEIYEENAKRCFEYCDIPQNASLTIEKQVDIAIGYWSAFVERCTSLNVKNVWDMYKVILHFIKILWSLLTIIPFVLQIIFSSPLVCLWHQNQWILTKLFKNKSNCSYYICSLFYFVISVFSLVWLIFSWGICNTVPLGVLIVAILKTCASNPSTLLLEVIIVIISVCFLWSYYCEFTKFYFDLVYKLGSSYQKKYEERKRKRKKKKKQKEDVILLNYIQGEEGHSIKVIPEKLFKNACKDRNLCIRKQVVRLLIRLLIVFLMLSFVWPIISREAIMATISPSPELTAVITYFAVASPKIHYLFFEEKFEVSTEDADKFVDDYITEMEGESVRDQ